MGLLLPFSAHTGVVPFQTASPDLGSGNKTKKVTPPRSTVNSDGAGLLNELRQEHYATAQVPSARAACLCRSNGSDTTSWLSYQLVTIVNGPLRG